MTSTMMTRSRLVLSLLLVLGAGLVACDSGGDDDAGTRVDGSTGVPALPPALANFEEGEAFVSRTLDFSCRGTRVQPTAGAAVSTTFQLRDFQDDFEVTGTEVWLFSDNVIADTCTAPGCQMFTTDAMGDGMVDLPADGWYAYRVIAREGETRNSTVFSVFQYNEPAPADAGGAVEGNSVSGSTIELIPALLGITREPGRALVSGRLEDCNGNFVQNSAVRLYDGDGNLVVDGSATTEPSYHYFNGNPDSNLPNQEETFSNVDGLYVVVQVPVLDDRPYRVEAYANLDGTTARVGCESARIFPDAVTILNVGPERADADPACME
ncbi:MAG: hypothetical protein AB8I08_17945 [Sandaracinaceae bacterium]